MNIVFNNYKSTTMEVAKSAQTPRFFVDNTSYPGRVLIVLMPNNGEKDECHMFNTCSDNIMLAFNSIWLCLFPNLHHPTPYKGLTQSIEYIGRNKADWAKAEISEQRPQCGPREVSSIAERTYEAFYTMDNIPADLRFNIHEVDTGDCWLDYVSKGARSYDFKIGRASRSVTYSDTHITINGNILHIVIPAGSTRRQADTQFIIAGQVVSATLNGNPCVASLTDTTLTIMRPDGTIAIMYEFSHSLVMLFRLMFARMVYETKLE